MTQTVAHSAFNGSGQDDLGNDSESWSLPDMVEVNGWHPCLNESVDGHTSRAVADVDLYAPAALSVSVRDRFTLPEIGLLEVVAVEDWNHGFHGWTPGSVVKLKQVTG